MPTKEQVLALYEASKDYGRVGEALGVPAGRAYLIATGMPADAGDALAPDELGRPGAIRGSTQHLVHRGAKADDPSTRETAHRWIEHRAASDAPMRRAAAARDAAPGEVKEPEETDVATVLTRDHDQVLALFKQLKTIPGATTGGSPAHLSRRKSIADMVSLALSKHETAEQQELWPAVRQLFPHGGSVVERALAQEQEGKSLLQQLNQLEPSDETFDDVVAALEKATRKHVAFEDQVLMTMRLTVPEEARRQLGDRVRRARDDAPTRPRPRAPKRPAKAVKATGAVVAAVDEVRDQAGDRPAERRGRAVQDEEASRPQATTPGAEATTKRQETP